MLLHKDSWPVEWQFLLDRALLNLVSSTGERRRDTEWVMCRSQRLAEELPEDVQLDGDCWHGWTETRAMGYWCPR